MRRMRSPRFQRKAKDWIWVPNVLTYTQGTTPLFTLLAGTADWAAEGGLQAKDRATLFTVRGYICVRPGGVSSSGMLAIGVKLDAAFDPQVTADYISEGDILWSAPYSFATASTEPVVYEVNIKSKRLLSSAAADAVELCSNATVASSAVIAVSLHALVNRA